MLRQPSFKQTKWPPKVTFYSFVKTSLLSLGPITFYGPYTQDT